MSAGNVSSSSVLKIGVAKQSGGSGLFGIPGQTFTGQSTGNPTVDEIRYSIMIVEYSITLTDWIFEVTSGPASAGKVRIALYRAGNDVQPIGAPVYDSGDVAVALGFTGTKSATGLSISLSPGIYIVGLNTNVTMTVRSVLSPTPIARTVLGTSALGNVIRVAVAAAPYNSFPPNPGQLWDSIGSASSAYVSNVLWRWTE